MILARKQHTEGDVRQYFVHYDEYLRTGYWLTAASVTSSNPTDFQVSGVSILEGHTVTFFVSGGVLNANYTLSLQATESNGEIDNDTIEFTVVAP